MLRRAELTGSYADVLQWLHENGWTDGLPVVPPTSDLVDAMVAASGSVPGHCLGAMPPLWADVTIEKLAVVAVMAGCTPDAFPIVIAATSKTNATRMTRASPAADDLETSSTAAAALGFPTDKSIATTACASSRHIHRRAATAVGCVHG